MKFLSQINVNTEYALPIVDGANGQVLTTDGNGAVYWGSVSVGSTNLNALTDVVITSPASGQILRYGIPVGSEDPNPVWYNWTPNFLVPSNVSGTTNYISKFTGANTVGNSQIFDNGTNVGIGTTAPSAGTKLQVEGNVFSNNVGGNAFSINSTGANYGFILNNSANTFSLGYGPSLGTVGTSVLTWNSAGNVGIGTTAPEQKLHVDGVVLSKGYIASGNYDGPASVPNTGIFSTNVNFADGFGSLIVAARPDAARPIVFATYNGSAMGERMRITSSGNVGIGTTSPSDILHVHKSGANTRMIVGNNAAYDQFIYFQGNNDWSIGIDNSNSNAFTISNYSTIGTNDRLTVTTGGNVGIGTTSPSYKLQVNGNAAFATNSGGLRIDSYDGDTAVIRPTVANGSILISDDSGTVGRGVEFLNGGGIVIQSLNTFDPLSVQSNGSTVLLAKSSGNVGIGTTSPQTRLQVNGSHSSFVSHFGPGSDNTSGRWSGISLGYSEANANYRKVGIVSETIGDGSARQNLHFLVDTANDSLSASLVDSKMMIAGLTGNVGIGTTSPNAKLDVNGAANATSFSSTALLITNADTSGSLQPDQGSPANKIYSFRWQGNEQGYIDTDAKITFAGFKTPTGTSSQFLKANGTVDSNVYITSAALSGYATQAWVNSNFYNQGQIDDFFSGAEPISGYNKSNWDAAYNDKVNSASFNTTNGILTLTQQDGGTVTVDLDGRYLTSETDSQTLAWDAPNKNISISNGNTVTLDGLATEEFVTGQGYITSYTETDTLDSVTDRGATTTNNISVGELSATGGIINLGTANTSSGHINAYENMTFNIDSDNDDTNRYFAWYTNGNAGGGSELMRLTEGGNVGIGTTSPAYKLDVNGSAGIYGDLNFTKADGTGINARESLIITIDSDNNDTGRVFQVREGSGNTLMLIQEAGNVGIGTTSPATRLHVKTSGNTDTGIRSDVGLDNNVASTPSAIFLNNIGGDTNDAVAATFGVGGADRAKIISGRYSTGGYLQFQTGDTSNNLQDRVIITNNGNVGVGNSSPQANGSSAVLDVGNGSGGTLNLRDTNTGIAAEGFNQIFGGDNRMYLYAGASGASSYMQFYTNDVERMRIHTNGNFGIGTTNPGERLHVVGPSNNWAAHFVSGNSESYFSYGAGYGAYINAGSSASSSTYILELISNGSTRMFVRGDGNVGIGTTAPGAKLHVNNDGTLNEQTIVVGISSISQRPTIQFSEGSTVEAGTGMSIEYDGRLSGTENKMYINGVDNVPKMTVMSGGNVGIGTTSPAAKLTVSGAGVEAHINNGDTNTLTLGNFSSGRHFIKSINLGVALTPLTLQASSFTFDTGNVGIGTTSPIAKLHISSSGTPLAAAIQGDSKLVVSGVDGNMDLLSLDDNSTVANSIGFGRFNSSTGALIHKFGITAWANTGSTGSNTGDRIAFNYGTLADAWSNSELMTIKSNGYVGIGTTNPSNRLQIGSIGSSGFGGNDIVMGNGTQVMAFFQSSTASTWYTNNNFALMPAGVGAIGNVGIGTDSPSTRLHVSGVITATGGNSTNWNTAYGWGNHATASYIKADSTEPLTIQAETVTFTGSVTVEGTLTESSSIRLKENIEPLPQSLEAVNALNPVSYNKVGADDREIGLIAEEVAELFPEVVTYNEEGAPTGVQYQRLSVILLKAVQELTERVNKLENK